MSSSRNVVVRLRAEVSDYQREMAKASKATADVGAKGSQAAEKQAAASAKLAIAEQRLQEMRKSGTASQSAMMAAEQRVAAARSDLAKATDAVNASQEKSNTVMGQAVASARDHGDAWRTAGQSLLAYGAVMTGITAMIVKQGIEYNTLQQTSRAALTTLLGSAKAANAQMDQLDQFARTSPFAKQVFINAQRQLIGFGYEAKQVLPILDAIQNAIAATGGSNQDIAELVRIFAQVRAAGKITAVDLMQFGQRGVDAAALIGSAMGKTGAQIRDEITNGTLDASAAIEALTQGMQDRFGGAAANVKNTWAGALDRVNAAIRDISSSFASGIVDPNGGGLGVDALNKLADTLRGFESLDPVMRNTAIGIGGMSGAAALAAGSFLVLAPRIVETQAAFATLASSMPRAVAAMSLMRGLLLGPWGAALALATAGVGLFMMKQGEARQYVDDLTNSIDSQTGAFTKNTRELVYNRLEQEGLLAIGEKFGITRRTMVDAALGEGDALAVVAQKAAEAKRRYEELSGAGMTLAEQSQAVADGTMSLGDGMSFASQEALAAYSEVNLLEQGLVGLADASAEAVEESKRQAAATAEAGEAASLAADGIQEYAQEQLDAIEAYQKWQEMVADSSASFVDMLTAYDNVIEKNKEVAQSTADATDDYIAELERQVTAQQEWQTNMLRLAGRVPQTILDELARLGPEGAALVADLAEATDEQLARIVELMGAGGKNSGYEFSEEFRLATSIFPAILRVAGQDAVDEAAAALSAGEKTLQQVIDQYNLNFIIDADTGEAVEGIRGLYRQYHNGRLVIRVVSDTSGYVVPRGGPMVVRAGGGGVFGPGTETSDSIPALLSHNEHVLSAREVRGLGGHAGVERLRAMARAGAVPAFAGGGYVRAQPSSGYYGQPAPASSGPSVEVNIPVQTFTRADPVAIGAQVAWQVGGLP